MCTEMRENQALGSGYANTADSGSSFRLLCDTRKEMFGYKLEQVKLWLNEYILYGSPFPGSDELPSVISDVCNKVIHPLKCILLKTFNNSNLHVYDVYFKGSDFITNKDNKITIVKR